LCDGDARILVLECKAEPTAKQVMLKFTKLLGKYMQNEETKKENENIVMLFNPNFKYTQRLYNIPENGKIPIIRLKEKLSTMLAASKMLYMDSFENKSLLDALIKLDQLRSAESMGQVLANRLLPSQVLLTKIKKSYADATLLEKDEQDILEKRAQKIQDEADAIARKLQQEMEEQQRQEAEQAKREIITYLDDLQYHLQREVVMDGIPLADSPAAYPHANHLLVDDADFSAYPVRLWFRVPIPERPNEHIMTRKGHDFEISKVFERSNRLGHVVIAIADGIVTPNVCESCTVRGTLSRGRVNSEPNKYFYCILVQEVITKIAKKVDARLPQEYLRDFDAINTTNFSAKNKKMVAELSSKTIKKKADATPEHLMEIDLPVEEDVFIYSSQKRKWTENQLKALREAVKKNPQAFVTYSKEYMSLALAPLSDLEIANLIQARTDRDDNNTKARWNYSTKLIPEKAGFLNNADDIVPQKQDKEETTQPTLPRIKQASNESKAPITSNKRGPLKRFMNADGTFPTPPDLKKSDGSSATNASEKLSFAGEAAYQDALKIKEKEDWENKVVVDDKYFYVHFADSHVHKPNPVDRHKTMLHGEPNKQYLKTNPVPNAPVRAVITSDEYHDSVKRPFDHMLQTEEMAKSKLRFVLGQPERFKAFYVPSKKDVDKSKTSSKRIVPMKDSEKTGPLFGKE